MMLMVWPTRILPSGGTEMMAVELRQQARAAQRRRRDRDHGEVQRLAREEKAIRVEPKHGSVDHASRFVEFVPNWMPHPRHSLAVPKT